VILVKNDGGLCNLFVHPSCYKQGIGRALFQAAVSICKEKPDIRKIQLNSSTFAAGFYEAVGFVQTGPALDRPGGCIPYEYSL
jgi:GNAT superfamily N-acetyltransferase